MFSEVARNSLRFSLVRQGALFTIIGLRKLKGCEQGSRSDISKNGLLRSLVFKCSSDYVDQT